MDSKDGFRCFGYSPDMLLVVSCSSRRGRCVWVEEEQEKKSASGVVRCYSDFMTIRILCTKT